MADHGEAQYATAEGNDLPAHEEGYTEFLQVVFLGTVMVITIVLGLAIGGVIGHWLSGGFVIIAAVVAAAISGWTGSRAASIVVAAISALLLLYNAYS
jgi:hypothetical protein